MVENGSSMLNLRILPYIKMNRGTDTVHVGMSVYKEVLHWAVCPMQKYHCPSITRNASIPQRMMTIFADTPSRNIIARRLSPMSHGVMAG